jgi:hypothetical protein
MKVKSVSSKKFYSPMKDLDSASLQTPAVEFQRVSKKHSCDY